MEIPLKKFGGSGTHAHGKRSAIECGMGLDQDYDAECSF